MVVVVFSKKRGRKKKKIDPRYDVMTLERQCPQFPHSDQQRQRGGHSPVDGADDFSDVRHNSTRFLLDRGYKARKEKNPGTSIIRAGKRSTPQFGIDENYSPCQGNLSI